jgi:hypothetical protein
LVLVVLVALLALKMVKLVEIHLTETLFLTVEVLDQFLRVLVSHLTVAEAGVREINQAE